MSLERSVSSTDLRNFFQKKPSLTSNENEDKQNALKKNTEELNEMKAQTNVAQNVQAKTKEKSKKIVKCINSPDGNEKVKVKKIIDDEEDFVEIVPKRNLEAEATSTQSKKIVEPKQKPIIVQEKKPVQVSSYFKTSPAKTVKDISKPAPISCDMEVIDVDGSDSTVAETKSSLLELGVHVDAVNEAIKQVGCNAMTWLEDKKYFSTDSALFLKKHVYKTSEVPSSKPVKSVLGASVEASTVKPKDFSSKFSLFSPVTTNPVKRSAFSISTEDLAEKDMVVESAVNDSNKKSKLNNTETCVEVATVEKSKPKWNPNQPRERPPLLGQKPLPDGADGCLEGLTFVLSGVLDSLERTQAEDMVKRYGGKVTGAISGKTSFLLLGFGGGKKSEEAMKRGVKTINEDEFFELILSKSKGKTRSAASPTPAISLEKKLSAIAAVNNNVASSPSQDTIISDKKVFKPSSFKPPAVTGTFKAFEKKESVVRTSSVSSLEMTPIVTDPSVDSNMLWVDKYKPRAESDLVGLNSISEKLRSWLKTWGDTWRCADPGIKLTSNSDPKKAALLSGGPGIGKTTIATLIATQLGYEVLALNASDSRSQKLIREQFSHVVANKSMSNYFLSKDDTSKAKLTKDTLLIMDEVDGMSSGDRGGMAELITMIKNSQIPIICICNDRQSQKIKSLVNYCLDLRVSKPTNSMVAKRLARICHLEGLNVDTNALENISAISNGDIRQAITMLYMWKRNHDALNYVDTVAMRTGCQKDVDRNLWDLPGIFFRPPMNKDKWLDERMDAYFFDTGLMPLFISDMYLSAVPANTSGTALLSSLDAIAAASESIADATLVERRIQSTQDYSLAQIHGIMSCVVPGYVMNHSSSGRTNFPAFLGKNSTRTKNTRLINELNSHLSHRITGGSVALVLDYFPLLKSKFTAPLINCASYAKEKINATITSLVEMMNQYGISKEDWDTLTTLNNYSNKELSIPSLIKSSFTRIWNKNGKCISLDDVLAKKSRARADISGTVEVDDDGVAIANDTMLSDESDQEEEKEIKKPAAKQLVKKSSKATK